MPTGLVTARRGRGRAMGRDQKAVDDANSPLRPRPRDERREAGRRRGCCFSLGGGVRFAADPPGGRRDGGGTAAGRQRAPSNAGLGPGHCFLWA